jgi:hypothetical protein
MPTVVGGLPAAFLQRQELIAKIDERHVVALAAQFEREQPAVERQRLIDVADLEGDVIEPDRTGFSCLLHVTSLLWTAIKVR